MKKMTLIALCSFSLTSCEEGMNAIKCYMNVKQKFPKAKIYSLGEYKYIVLDSNKVYEVKTLNFRDSKVSDVIELKPLN